MIKTGTDSWTGLGDGLALQPQTTPHLIHHDNHHLYGVLYVSCMFTIRSAY